MLLLKKVRKLTCIATWLLTMLFASLSYAQVTLDWTDLMPEEDLQLLLNMPEPEHGDLSEEPETLNTSLRSSPSTTQSNHDEITTASKETQRTWKDALVSTDVRAEWDKKNIRLAGYVVPIEYNEKNLVTQFFLVPYFGACIHVPPPPPNQIIFIDYPQGFAQDELYTPYWISGTLRIETVDNEVAMSSYRLAASKIIEYQEGDIPE